MSSRSRATRRSATSASRAADHHGTELGRRGLRRLRCRPTSSLVALRYGRRIGRHDFDFLHGDWRVEHHRLRRRLAGSTDWDLSAGTATCRPVLDGFGNVDQITVPAIDTIGMTLRLFDPTTNLWSLHWASTTAPRLDPPLTGSFDDGVGTFAGTDLHDDVPIRVRFVWDEITSATARWTQSFSVDDGASWEPNWTMHFRRLAPAADHVG
jgi:hypothetical protein